MTDRATIERDEQVDTGGAGGKEPIHELVTIAENVRCQYSPRETMREHVEAGERIERPATVRFPASTDIQEGDVVTIDDIDTTFEARGVDQIRDAYRGRVNAIVVELGRRD